MSSNLIDAEFNRFKRVADIFNYVSRQVETLKDANFRTDLFTNLCELEDLMFKSPEWESREVIAAVNMTIFGTNTSGKRNLLKKFLPYNIDEYSLDSAIRLKNHVTLEGQSHLVLIRDDGEFLPFPSVSEWTDCALFIFNLNDEKSYSHALVSQFEFLKLPNNRNITIPTILVGVADRVVSTDVDPSKKPMLLSYESLLSVARARNFYKYIEVRSTGHNINFLFEYATALVQRIRTHGDISKVVSEIEENPDKGKENIDVDPIKRRSMVIQFFKKPELPKKRVSNINEMGPISSKKLLRSDSVSKNLVKSSKNNSKLSLLSISSDDSAGSPQNRGWHRFAVLKQGFVTKTKLMSSEVYLTITTNGMMFYHNSQKNYIDKKDPKFIDVTKYTVKVPGHNNLNGFMVTHTGKRKRSVKKNNADDRTFEMQAGQNSNLIFKTDVPEERDIWVNAIKEATFFCISKNLIKTQDMAVLDNLKEVQEIDSNKYCADCNAEKPGWINCRLGIFVCTRCSGGHRSMNFPVSSTTLDSIDDMQVKIISVLGNGLVNSVFEATLDLSDFSKPVPGDNDISNWLKMKYVEKRFAGPLPLPNELIPRQLMYAITERDYRTQLICLYRATLAELNQRFSADDDRNPLLIAAQSGDVISLQLLLWAGVDRFVKDKNQLNTYSYALYTKSPDRDLALQILRDSGVQEQILYEDTECPPAVNLSVTCDSPIRNIEPLDHKSMINVTKRKR